MRISTVGYSVKQGVKNIGRNKMFSLASVATMAACIFVFGLFFSIIMNFQYIVHKAEEGVAITVFFNDDATQEQIDNIGTQLKKQDGVKEIKYVSADEAWETFKDQYFGESSDLAEGFKNDNPLAGSDNYEVYMTDVASQKKLVSFAESLDGVRKVNKSDTVANTLNSVNKLVWYVSAVIIAILLAVSIFLISNTVTMGITVRREEIAIMKYIGAKDGFVRAPFIIEGILIGLVVALVRLGAAKKGRRTILSTIADIYVDVIRGTPSVLQLMIIYFAVFHSRLGYVAAVVSFGINSGAYVSEVIRGGILSVDKGQSEAGRSLGLGYKDTMRFIIIPQAVKTILPAMGNEFIQLIKETSILGYVGIMDLTKAASYVSSRTYQMFIPLIVAGIMYYLIVKCLSLLLKRFERRLRESD